MLNLRNNAKSHLSGRLPWHLVNTIMLLRGWTQSVLVTSWPFLQHHPHVMTNTPCCPTTGISPPCTKKRACTSFKITVPIERHCLEFVWSVFSLFCSWLYQQSQTTWDTLFCPNPSFKSTPGIPLTRFLTQPKSRDDASHYPLFSTVDCLLAWMPHVLSDHLLCSLPVII